MSASHDSVLPVDMSRRGDSVWVSFGYFNVYRLVVATVFFVAILALGKTAQLGSERPLLFSWASLAYWILAVVFYATYRRLQASLNVQLSVHVLCDIIALTLMMHASGGPKSGLSIVLLITLAGAGLVGQGRMVVFYAALATLFVLGEQAYRFVVGQQGADFFLAGIISAAFFVSAISARLVGQRLVYNEALARQRGRDLMNEHAISQRVIRDMQDGVLVVSPSGRVRHSNPAVESLFGMQATGQPSLSDFSEALASKHRQIVSGEHIGVSLLRAPHSGRNLRARFVGAGEGGDVVVYLEDLERVQKQAQQLKLAALGRLTANMAHEIRNPLSAISHAAELLREERRSDMQARLARIIIDNSMRLERLVRDVLELGRRIKAEPEPIRLRQFLETFIEELVAREDVPTNTVALDAPADAVICFDRIHLNQVLWNLLTNALRYSGRAEGSIRVSARSAEQGGRVELHVVDDGPGIPEESRNQVFEPFFTTYARGTGLGLYIARELCEANRAALELLDNDPGAHFRITGRSNEWDDKIEEAAAP